jgi:uncharacterized damage-inducible protein DinB
LLFYFMTPTLKWFDRNFITQDTALFNPILERLRGTPARVEERISSIPRKYLSLKLAGQWSIQENIGHLLDLEPLWYGRLEDILVGAEKLRPTDLANAATDAANHNAKDIKQLLEGFRVARTALVQTLENLSEDTLSKTALHPRLNTPMSIVDKMFFVAEHDDYHLATISAIVRTCQALEP